MHFSKDDITILGGRGSITAETVSGEIYIEGAEGVIEANSVAEDVRITNSSGEVYVETVGGSIILEGLSASIVYSTDLFDATSVVRFAKHFTNLLQSVARDPDRALELLRQAAEKGLNSAGIRLADLLADSLHRI